MARKMDVEEYPGLIARGDIYNMARALARALPTHHIHYTSLSFFH